MNYNILDKELYNFSKRITTNILYESCKNMHLTENILRALQKTRSLQLYLLHNIII